MKKVKKNHGAASLNSVLANAQKKAELGASLMTFAEAAYANGEIREASNFMLTASAEFFSCRDDLVRAAEVNPANRAQLLEAAGAMFGAGMDANDKSTLIYNGNYMVSKGGTGSGRRPESAKPKESAVHARRGRELRDRAARLHSEGIRENHGKVNWKKVEGLIGQAKQHEAESEHLLAIGKGGQGSGRHAEGVNLFDMTPIQLLVRSMTQMKNGESQGAAVAGHDLTITYRSRQALGDNGLPARGYVSGSFTVSEAGKPSKVFEHTPVGPTLENAKRYAAENVADYIQTLASRSLAPAMQSAAMRSASASVAKGGPGSGRKKEAINRAQVLQDNVAVKGTYQGAADEHRAIAEIHQKLANEFRASMGDRSPSDFDGRAAAAHLDAAKAHDRAMKLLANDPDLENDETKTAIVRAKKATDNATFRSVNAEMPITVWHND